MFRIRTTKTASGNTAVQVVVYKKHQTIVFKHIGSGKNKEEINSLKKLAHQYILTKENSVPLFPEVFGLENKNGYLVDVENIRFTKTYHVFAYEFMLRFYQKNGFGEINNKLLKDLVLMRVIEPVSKLQSIELIEKYFGIKYTKNIMYKGLRIFNSFKSQAETIAINYAKKYLSFDFTLVFYDVTTLYFETFDGDDLRKCGFSKDGKSNQPQVLIALVVNRDGYPIAIDIFEGNKFEGHTIIPVILGFKKKYKIERLTVVADAAMLSYANLEDLEKHKINYIVAARLSSLSEKLLKEASTFLSKKEGIYFQKETEYGLLICDYSKKRASKDRSDRNKQIIKAQNQINDPTKISKRSRFVRETTKSTYVLNQELIEKDQMLDGIKGYYTNLKNTKDELIVTRYKDLWIIEKSFRIAKSDLLARPIFHRKKESIEAHILIVFISLCLSKSIEIITGSSIKKIKNMTWEVLDVCFEDKKTNKSFVKRMDNIPDKIQQILENLN